MKFEKINIEDHSQESNNDITRDRTEIVHKNNNVRNNSKSKDISKSEVIIEKSDLQNSSS